MRHIESSNKPALIAQSTPMCEDIEFTHTYQDGDLARMLDHTGLPVWV